MIVIKTGMSEYLFFIPPATDSNLWLTVENKALPSGRILGLHVVVIDLQGGIGAGSRQTDDMVFAVVDFDSQFAQTVVVRSHIVDSKQIAIDLSCQV